MGGGGKDLGTRRLMKLKSKPVCVGGGWGGVGRCADVPAGDLSVRSGKIFFLGKTDTD